MEIAALCLVLGWAQSDGDGPLFKLSQERGTLIQARVGLDCRCLSLLARRFPAMRGLSRLMCAQRGSIADEPEVAERVSKAALPVNAPGSLVVTNLVNAPVRPGCHGVCNETIGIVHKDLDAYRPGASRGRGIPAVVRRFAQEEWGTLDRQSHDAAYVPQFGRPECLCVPLRGCRSIGHSKHDGNDWTVSSLNRVIWLLSIHEFQYSSYVRFPSRESCEAYLGAV